MNKLTPFGRAIRHIRLDQGVLLGDVAKKLNVSTSYLSQIETGAKLVPDGLIDRLADTMSLSQEQVAALRSAAQLSAKEFRIAMKKGATDRDRQLAHRLASSFARLTDRQKESIRNIVSEN